MTPDAARPPTRRPPRYRGWAVVAVVAAMAVFPATEPRAVLMKDDTFVDAQTNGILTIEGGECFTDPAYSTRLGDVVVLYASCEEGADNQSYAFLHAPDGPWDRPGLVEFARAGCGRDFARRWTSREASGLDHYPVLPTEETWADGDRDVMCVVYRPGERITRSLVPLVR
ncbi:hypothetical protein [Micromonospora sp. SH-82]|uniref:hypothetical protein n=1 Tax=Micromonospora sp. SH-82 TaxID=3132938 RepID=UPI003EB6FF51